MTTFEHVLLGINGATASGLTKRHGWKIAALAGVAATVPDWDGLTIVVSQSAFATGHRLWGHNLLTCVLAGLFLGGLDYRFDLMARCGRRLTRWARWLHLDISAQSLVVRRSFRSGEAAAWIVVATAAVLSHLPADAVVSGTATLPDWELHVLWPFSDCGWVYPLIPWGDAGVTIIFVAGLFAMVRWKQQTQPICAATLAAMAIYLAVRGAMAA